MNRIIEKSRLIKMGKVMKEGVYYYMFPRSKQTSKTTHSET